MTPWNWKSCRVVMRRVLFAYVRRQRSQAKYCSAFKVPPGNFVRTMKMNCLPTFRLSRSSC